MNTVLRIVFFAVLVRPLTWVVLGLNLRHPKRLPSSGPAILVANHNSHLDTLVLMSVFPLRMLPRLRPVAAMDYFLRNRLLAWLSQRLIGILPLPRHPSPGQGDCFAEISRFLMEDGIVIFYPEGSRGEPEKLGEFKNGIAHLSKRHPDVPVTPIFLHGLGKALPKGEALLVPFFCDLFVGEPMRWPEDRATFVGALHDQMEKLAVEGKFPPWE
jgi:1-acyl-sn-glycerol-3-phosphate acyltransferase